VHQLAFDEKRTLPTPAMEIRNILSRSKDLESLYTLVQLQYSSAEFEQGCGVTFECHDAKKLEEMSEKPKNHEKSGITKLLLEMHLDQTCIN